MKLNLSKKLFVMATMLISIILLVFLLNVGKTSAANTCTKQDLQPNFTRGAGFKPILLVLEIEPSNRDHFKASCQIILPSGFNSKRSFWIQDTLYANYAGIRLGDVYLKYDLAPRGQFLIDGMLYQNVPLNTTFDIHIPRDNQNHIFEGRIIASTNDIHCETNTLLISQDDIDRWKKDLTNQAIYPKLIVSDSITRKISLGATPNPSPTPTATATASPTVALTPASTAFTPTGMGTKGDYESGWFGPGKFPEYMKNVYSWAVALGIVLAILMIVWGGYEYATSAGDIEKINKGKERMVGAVLGLLLLLLASLILQAIGVGDIAAGYWLIVIS